MSPGYPNLTGICLHDDRFLGTYREVIEGATAAAGSSHAERVLPHLGRRDHE
jgi:hypothetical protein